MQASSTIVPIMLVKCSEFWKKVSGPGNLSTIPGTKVPFKIKSLKGPLGHWLLTTVCHSVVRGIALGRRAAAR